MWKGNEHAIKENVELCVRVSLVRHGVRKSRVKSYNLQSWATHDPTLMARRRERTRQKGLVLCRWEPTNGDVNEGNWNFRTAHLLMLLCVVHVEKTLQTFFSVWWWKCEKRILTLLLSCWHFLPCNFSTYVWLTQIACKWKNPFFSLFVFVWFSFDCEW